jgi:biopolymer transport protein TolR
MKHTRRRHPTMSQINVVPFIDVVLVLLIIFMVTAPMLQVGQIELPKVGQASSVSRRPLEIRLKASKNEEDTPALSLRGAKGGRSEERFDSTEALIERLKGLNVQGDNAQPVVLAADKGVPYGEVVQLLDQLKRQSIAQVGLLLQIDGK